MRKYWESFLCYFFGGASYPSPVKADYLADIACSLKELARRERIAPVNQSFVDTQTLVVTPTPVVNNLVETVVQNTVNVDVPEIPEFPEVSEEDRFATAIVEATAKGKLGTSKADLVKYGDDVYRLTCALVAAKRRNMNAINEAYWTPLG